jgi:predicted nucleic acid-binding protein
VILTDANIWIDHLRSPDRRLLELTDRRGVAIHRFTIGELALGSLADRALFLERLALLPPAPVARHDEVVRLIEAQHLFGTGIGYVDSHLLASTLLLDRGMLWTRDRRLRGVAMRLGIAAPLD